MAARGRVGPNGPTPTDTDSDTDSELLQAMRNLWPILSLNGRRQATDTAKGISDRPAHP